MSKTHSNRLIAAAETMEILTPTGVIPKAESVASARVRQLAGLCDV